MFDPLNYMSERAKYDKRIAVHTNEIRLLEMSVRSIDREMERAVREADAKEVIAEYDLDADVVEMVEAVMVRCSEVKRLGEGNSGSRIANRNLMMFMEYGRVPEYVKRRANGANDYADLPFYVTEFLLNNMMSVMREDGAWKSYDLREAIWAKSKTLYGAAA